MKKITGILIFVLVAYKVTGQNLVPNGNFELVASCLSDTTQKFSKFWYNPNDGTADHFSFLSSGWGCTPYIYSVECVNPNINYQGYQLPHTGLGHGGFATYGGYYDTTSIGEYLATRLSDSLQMNKKYCVSYWVNMASSTRWALDAIGIVFKKDSIIGSSSQLYCCTFPDVDSPVGVCISDTANWVLVQDTFIARGGERFMVIGHLRHNNLTTYCPIDTVGQGDGRFAYYYVDDISVTYCDLPQDTPVNPEFPEITLTPNPGNGEFLLKGNFPTQSKIEVFDMLGKKVWDTEIPEGNQTFPVNLNLAAAVYTYQIKNSDVVLKNGKLIIVK